MSLLRRLTSFGVLTIMLSLTACVTTKVESNKDPNFQQKLQKILLVFSSDKQTRAYFDQLNADLRPAFATHQVKTRTMFLSEISLDPDKELQAEIDVFQPDALLLIVPKGGTISNQGWGMKSLVGLNLDLQLRVPGKTTPVWRASTTISGGDVEMGITKTSNEILKTMRRDGLID